MSALLLGAVAVTTGSIITFLVLLAVAALVYYLAGLFLPHPIPVILAVIVVVLAVANLLG